VEGLLRRCLASAAAEPCHHTNFQVSATSKGGWWSGEEPVFSACSADDVLDAGGGRSRRKQDEVAAAKNGDTPRVALGCQIQRPHFSAKLLRAATIGKLDSRLVNYCSNAVRRICSTQALAIGQLYRRKSWQMQQGLVSRPRLRIASGRPGLALQHCPIVAIARIIGDDEIRMRVCCLT